MTEYNRADWICEGGHPYHLIDGKKMCGTCEEITLKGAREMPCLRGHVVPLGQKGGCNLCGRYRKVSWQEVLDREGEAVCPKGHVLTHATLTYGLRAGMYPERRCGQCALDGVMRANHAYVARREAVAASEGRTVRRRGTPGKRLKPDYFDWVVALRLIEGKIDEVYEMSRGGHRGATAMEKWIAYHSTDSNYRFTRTIPSGDQTVRFQWAEYGEQEGWPPKTLAQAIRES